MLLQMSFGYLISPFTTRKSFSLYFYYHLMSFKWLLSETLDGINSCIASDCTVLSTGNVSCKNACEHSAYCADPDYADWPFDKQRCTYEYISRTRNINQLKFENHSVVVDNEEGWESDAWKMKSPYLFTGRRPYLFDGFNTSHPYVLFNFQIERHNQGYFHQTVIPAIAMAVVNVALLLLKPESAERVVLLVINLLSHFVFVEQLRWM